MKAAVAVFIHSNKGNVLDFPKNGVNLIHTITFFFWPYLWRFYGYKICNYAKRLLILSIMMFSKLEKHPAQHQTYLHCWTNQRCRQHFQGLKPGLQQPWTKYQNLKLHRWESSDWCLNNNKSFGLLLHISISEWVNMTVLRVMTSPKQVRVSCERLLASCLLYSGHFFAKSSSI